MCKADLIKELERKLKDINKNDMSKSSWGYEEGVLLSGNEVKSILKILKK